MSVADRLKDKTLYRTSSFIDGAWVKGEGAKPILNPANNETNRRDRRCRCRRVPGQPSLLRGRLSRAGSTPRRSNAGKLLMRWHQADPRERRRSGHPDHARNWARPKGESNGPGPLIGSGLQSELGPAERMPSRDHGREPWRRLSPNSRPGGPTNRRDGVVAWVQAMGIPQMGCSGEKCARGL